MQILDLAGKRNRTSYLYKLESEEEEEKEGRT